MAGMIEVDGIWLRTVGSKIQVLVEVGGTWRIAIEAKGFAEKQRFISHLEEPFGIKHWPHDEESPQGTRDRHCDSAGS